VLEGVNGPEQFALLVEEKAVSQHAPSPIFHLILFDILKWTTVPVLPFFLTPNKEVLAVHVDAGRLSFHCPASYDELSAVEPHPNVLGGGAERAVLQNRIAQVESRLANWLSSLSSRPPRS
jgi:hypothetical protein